MPTPIRTILIFPKIQIDTAIAVFLLREFGEQEFPGIAKANFSFSAGLPDEKTGADLETEGVLALDFVGARFDHHPKVRGEKPTECASTIVAKALGIEKNPALQKLLIFAKRDDLEGKGVTSADPIDRAFSLPGMLMTLNRQHAADPAFILTTILPLIEAHYRDMAHRMEELPKLWKQLKAEGKAQEFLVPQGRKNLRVVALISDNVSLPGFLRAWARVDVVIQRLPSGHTNIITKQDRRVDLREVIRFLRFNETKKRGIPLSDHTLAYLHRPGRIDEAPEWFYDTAANTIQNGGVRPEGVTPTLLSLEEIVEIVREGLAEASELPPTPSPASHA